MDQKPFVKGQRAYCMMVGWGTITDTNSGSSYPILFIPDADVTSMVYTGDGTYYEGLGERVLFHERPIITGFEPEPKPLPDLEVDTPLWVRNAKQPVLTGWHRRHFAKWSPGGKAQCFCDGTTSHGTDDPTDLTTWDEYSLTDPNEN